LAAIFFVVRENPRVHLSRVFHIDKNSTRDLCVYIIRSRESCVCVCVHFGNGFKPQAETHERSKQLWCKCMNENDDDDMEEKPKVFPELPGLISYVFVF
jgi:hypothetical protein